MTDSHDNTPTETPDPSTVPVLPLPEPTETTIQFPSRRTLWVASITALLILAALLAGWYYGEALF